MTTLYADATTTVQEDLAPVERVALALFAMAVVLVETGAWQACYETYTYALGEWQYGGN